MTTVFTYDPTGFALTLERDPDIGGVSLRDLQLALFETASGKPRALRNKVEILRVQMSFDELCAQDHADLVHFHAKVAQDQLNQFRVSMKASIATPIACGEQINGSTVACGQNLSDLDQTLPAENMVCGRLYHGQRTISLPRCRFEAGTFSCVAKGGNQRTGYEASFALLCEWGS